MSVSIGGLKKIGGSTGSAAVVAALIGQDIVARSYLATGGPGTTYCFQARNDVGPGSTGKWISLGTPGSELFAIGQVAGAAFIQMSFAPITLTSCAIASDSPIQSNSVFVSDNSNSVGFWLRGTNTGGTFQLGNSSAIVNKAPTISSGFGTSPSIVANTGSFAFTVNVGTGGIASTGVIAMPAFVANNGWAVTVHNITSPDTLVVGQTGTTTTTVSLKSYSRTTGLATAFNASDVLSIIAVAY